jgi:hypothetical protein
VSLEALCNTHRANRHSLTKASDALGGQVETLSARETTLACRAVTMTTADKEKYGVARDVEGTLFVFSDDPGLSASKALVWDGKVWRIRTTRNSGGIDMVWTAGGEYVPQVELSAP